MSTDIKEPPILLEEHKRKGCLAFVDGTLTYFINRYTQQDLLWSFWFNYAESSFYEDPSLANDFYETLTSRENWVPYSETIVIKEEDVARRNREYPLGYRRLALRLDFYVTKEEFKQAFLALKVLGSKQGDKRVRETTIFGCVRVILLTDRQFCGAAPPLHR